MATSKSLMGDQFKYSVDYHRFSDYLGLDVSDRNVFQIAKKVGLLYDWGRTKSGSANFVDITKEVSKLQKKLGVTYVGKPLVSTLMHWARIDMDNGRVKMQKRLEREKLRQAEERVGAYHQRAKAVRKRHEEEKSQTAVERKRVKKEADKYIRDYKKNRPKEKALKVKEVAQTESVAVPV